MVVKIKKKMDSIFKRLSKYLEKEDMILNRPKAKIISFNRSRGQEAKEKLEDAEK